MARKSKISTTTNPDLTLSSLCEAYLASLLERGQSEGTIFSYRMELATARAELGADTKVADLTAERIAEFNVCTRVMRKKTGKLKAEPSFLKTRRTLRLCLAFGEQSGLIAKSPVDARKDALPGATDDEQATPTESTPKRRGRKQALVLEVPQPEAEAAADVAEAMFTAPETAA